MSQMLDLCLLISANVTADHSVICICEIKTGCTHVPISCCSESLEGMKTSIDGIFNAQNTVDMVCIKQKGRNLYVLQENLNLHLSFKFLFLILSF